MNSAPMIRGILKFFILHPGWHTSREIMMEFGIDDCPHTRPKTRAILKQVQYYAASKGIVIVSGGRGFMISSDVKEIKEYKESARRRAYSYLDKVAFVSKAQRVAKQKTLFLQ